MCGRVGRRKYKVGVKLRKILIGFLSYIKKFWFYFEGNGEFLKVFVIENSIFVISGIYFGNLWMRLIKY